MTSIPQRLSAIISHLLSDISLFCEYASHLKLRSYQLEVARAILDSVLNHKGLTFVVIFPRQSGKNELQAQIEAYLLALLYHHDAEIIKISPTWKPQSLNAMRRLERVLERNTLTRSLWKKEQGYIYRNGAARVFFLSGAPTANIIGATASTLLECDEAQDVSIAKWDKEISPMAASTNATRVFWGTAWTSQTLLAREKAAALDAQKQDGIRRLFQLQASDVSREVPAYARYVAEQVSRLGRHHPFIRTQYFSEESEDHAGMFPPARRLLMQGSHPPLTAPKANEIYAFLLDIAGEDEAVSEMGHTEILTHSTRDSTALTIIRVDLTLLTELRLPRYQVVYRRLWTGTRHTQLFGQLTALADLWQPRFIVCDSTGVGAGLTSFLNKTYGKRIIPFIFSLNTKSKLGWDFLSVIETGRFQDHASFDVPNRSHYHPFPDARGANEAAILQSIFFRQLEFCQMEILPGPGKLMRWSVPDGARDPGTGSLVHDDLLISASLCALLDDQTWGQAKSAVIPAPDILNHLRQTG